MGFEKAVEFLSVKSGKMPSYIKGLFTKHKNLLDEKFDDSLPEEKKVVMALKKIAKQYNLEIKEVEKCMSEEDLENEYLMGEGEAEANQIEESEYVEEEGEDAWKRWRSTIPDPIKKGKDFVKLPALIIEIGPTYTMKLMNPKLAPFSKEFDGQYGKYTKHAIKVTLLNISDKAMYDMKYTKGDMTGKPAFVDGADYTLWMDDKCAGFYNIFWRKMVGDGMPDDRPFTYKFKKNGKYNVYEFKEAKK